MVFFARALGLCAASTACGAAMNGFSTVAAKKSDYIADDPKNPGAFSFEKYQRYPLAQVLNLAEDVAIFRFLLQSPDQAYDMYPCSTLSFWHGYHGNPDHELKRSYTPITPAGTRGYFDIMVKKQYQGKMTEALFSMKLGETIKVARQPYKLIYSSNKYKKIGMIAGGTGVTPMLQLIRSVNEDPEDVTPMHLLFCNISEDKILLRSVINDLVTQSREQLKVTYMIDETDQTNAATWKGLVGYVGPEAIKATMPLPSERRAIIFLCGPDGMLASLTGAGVQQLRAMSGGNMKQGHGNTMNHSLGGVRAEMGYRNDQVYRF